MMDSKVFRFTKEIVFHDSQPCDAERYVGLALSQGGLQAVHKVDPNLLGSDVAAFRNRIEAHFSATAHSTSSSSTECSSA